KPHICSDFGTTHQCLNVLTNLSRQPTTPFEEEYREKMLAAMSGWEISELLSQSFAIYSTLLPIKSVGVQGDSRVVYVFGDPVVYPVTTITPTYLNAFTVKTLQE
ncbi:hypothetical protein ANCCEY_15340, partial [Ancylostoma ceylanicum]